ncbi:MAG: rod shape-determining protein MreC [Bacteroidia bacterium]|nr:rod shape-determining protein MreC [Bacteroidia bacterium]NNM16559.1 rod shape-determining protein MreC [Bacteroidia bacterium]
MLYFIALEVICASLIIQNKNFHKSSFINSSNYAVGGFYNQVSGIQDYFSLRDQNQVLAEENAIFRTLQNDTPIISISDSLNALAEDTLHQYSYKVARVVNNSVNKRLNYLTINKGSKHGIKKEMGVIDQNGIVGVVHNVSNNYATVRSILHTESMVSAGLKNSNYFGSLIWEGKDPTEVRLKDIPKHANIKVGDSVVTTAYSSIFSEGIPVGRVTEVIDKDELSFKELDIRLVNDISNTVYVYVIDNKRKSEQTELEKSNDN